MSIQPILSKKKSLDPKNTMKYVSDLCVEAKAR